MSIRKKSIIFDIDGTLWNTTEVVATAWNKALRKVDLPELRSLTVTAQMLQKEFGKPMDVIADHLFGAIDPDAKAAMLELCCEYEHEELENCEEDLTYPGVRETIQELSKENDLYIVSNCQDGYIEQVIRKNQLEPYIKDYECFGRTGLQKDGNIRLVLERNQISEEDAFYVGDIMGDYIATKKAGLAFIHAAYGFGQVEEAEYVIHSMPELLKLELHA